MVSTKWITFTEKNCLHKKDMASTKRNGLHKKEWLPL